MKLSEHTLQAGLSAILTGASHRAAAKAMGITEQTFYTFVRASKQHAQEGRKESPYLIRFGEHPEAQWFHEWLRQCRAANLLTLASEVQAEALDGRVEYVLDPSTGRKIPKLDPQWMGVADQVMIDKGLDPVRDRWVWRCDDIGLPIEPEWETTVKPMPASLKIKALTGLLPTIFGDRVQVDQNIRTATVVHVAPAPYVTKAERIAKGEIIDAEFESTKPTLDELKARAAKLLARPDRITAPQGVVRDAYGQPVSDRVAASRQRSESDASNDDERPRAEPPLPPDRGSGSTRTSMSSDQPARSSEMAQQPPAYQRRPRPAGDHPHSVSITRNPRSSIR